MKLSFYPKLAISGLKKNRKLYLPYLMTCTLMVSVYYILAFLTKSGILGTFPGGDSVNMVLMLGCWVIIIFSAIFLFYTNSFLIRRRKKEFGLYNVLGMNKANLAHIVFWETVVTFAASMIMGLALGIATSKLAELALMNVVKTGINFEFVVPVNAVLATLVLYGVIFSLILFNSIRQVGFAKPIDLIKSANVGEKPPKANWFFGLAGVIVLAAAYYLAVTIEEPILALMAFFVAVIMVIVATYLIFISGSVLFCRILQKNKNYYYKSNHFVSVSSMAYRMKRNGAGLASICILITMVLVMISSSASLYFGANDCIEARYPRDICTKATAYGFDEANPSKVASFKAKVSEEADKAGVKKIDQREYNEYTITGIFDDDKNQVIFDMDKVDTRLTSSQYDHITSMHFISLDDYNRIYGRHETLAKGEILLASVIRDKVEGDIDIGGYKYHIKKSIPRKDIDFEGSTSAEVVENLFVITPDVNSVVKNYQELREPNGTPFLLFRYINQFDIDSEDKAVHEQIVNGINAYHDDNGMMLMAEGQLPQHEDFFGTFGGLFFIGVLLSIVFLVAAVIIIYYKQLSEGFEDQSRFEIMKKIGMTKEEIKKSINSQMLLVFLLPIVFAMLHLAFAFPFIHKLLMLFGLVNLKLQIITSGTIVLICAVFYMAVYKITSNTYYHIVSDAR